MAALRTKAERRKAGLFPSADVDVDTALELLDWSWYRFARSTERVAPEVIHQLLEALAPATKAGAVLKGKPASPRSRTAAVFLVAATDTRSEGRLRETWSDAVGALKVFESQYAWGSKEKAARLADVRANPRLVEAAQAASVASAPAPLELLAVLALEGSEASADALMPHVEGALANPLLLEPLARLGRFAAKTKPMTALMGLIEAKLAEARGTSPAMALATSLGLASGASFRVEVRVPADKGSLFLDVDSGKGGPGFRGYVHLQSTAGQPLVTSEGVAVCELAKLPKWLAQWARTNDVTWSFNAASTRHLRGKRAQTFLAWLEGRVLTK